MFYGFISLFIFALLWMAYKIVIRPLYRMRFYKKQGIETYYAPLFGRYKALTLGIKLHQDDQYFIKRLARMRPMRAICSNYISSAVVVLKDPKLIKEFYLNSDNYIKDPSVIQNLSFMFDKGLLTDEGNEWRAQRKLFSSFFNLDFLKTNLPTIQATVHQMLHDLRNGDIDQVNLMDEFQKITGEVIGRIFFGDQLIQYTSEGQPLTTALGQLYLDFNEQAAKSEILLLGVNFIKKGILPNHRKLMNRVKAFRNTCQTIIDARRKQIETQAKPNESPNILDVLLTSTLNGEKISDKEIVDHFITFLESGMDTTARLLTVVVHFLYTRPQYRAKVIDEIKQNYSSGESVTIEDLNKLNFTMAVLKETLRVATPFTTLFLRMATKDHKLDNITIRKGDKVEVEFLYNHYNPVYFKSPDGFFPERWFDKEMIVDPFAYTPFSAGPRNCIGQQLAMIESRIILAEFLKMYDFRLDDFYVLKMNHRILYEPVDPIFAMLTVKEKVK